MFLSLLEQKETKMDTKQRENIHHYIDQALRTDLSPEQYAQAAKRQAEIIRLEHASKGLVTETGELVDQIKRHVFYGKPLDFVNLIEEGGDLMWYLAIFFDEIQKQTGIEAWEILERNIRKLRVRYPEKFDNQQALFRDTNAERVTLEGIAQTAVEEGVKEIVEESIQQLLPPHEPLPHNFLQELDYKCEFCDMYYEIATPECPKSKISESTRHLIIEKKLTYANRRWSVLNA